MIQHWFAKRPRFHVHFTLTYGSWLNLVEPWFAELTNRQLRRGVHRSVAQLKSATREFIVAHHANPKPFVRTKSADEILASIARFAQRTLDFQAAPLIVRTTRSGHQGGPIDAHGNCVRPLNVGISLTAIVFSWQSPLEVESRQPGCRVRLCATGDRTHDLTARRARLHFSRGGVAIVVTITMITTAEKSA